MRPLPQRRDRGVAIPIVAVLLPVLILMTAFAIDLGMQRSSRRDMQAKADVIALDLVRLTDDVRTEHEIVTDAGYIDDRNGSTLRNGITCPSTAALAVVCDAGSSPVTLTIAWGQWDGHAFHDTGPGEIPNAVEVIAEQDTDYRFQTGSGHTVRSAVATAGQAEGCFSIGSFAAGLSGDSGTILDMLLGGLFGASPELQVLGYNGLASAEVNVLDLIEAIPRVGTPTEVVQMPITVGEFYVAVIGALPQDDPGDIEVALLELIAANPDVLNDTIVVADLVSLVPGGEGAAALATVNVLDMVTGGLLLADGTHAVNLPGLGVSVAGVTLDASATLVEAIRTHCGPEGTSQSTDQVRLDVMASLAVDAAYLDSLLGPVNGALGGALDPVLNTLDGILDVLGGLTCAVLGIGCPDDPIVEATISVRAAGATGWLNSVECPGDLPQADLTTVTQLASIDVGLRIAGTQLPPLMSLQLDGGSEDHLTDDSQPLPQEIPFGRDDLGLTEVDSTVLGAALGPILDPILEPLDSLLLSPLLDLVGVDIAGGDLIVRSATCGGLRLVR